MNASPVLINTSTDKGKQLTRIEAIVRDDKSELWLQELLYEHPQLIPVDEFDDFYGPLIPIGREVPTDSGPIDNLYVSPSGSIIVVETKLWKNPEKHRTVVAQIIDYAKELTRWSYERLEQAVLTCSRNRGEKNDLTLHEKVAPYLAPEGLNLAEFQDAISTNLIEGNFLLLIVGDRISPNITLLSQALHNAPGLGFTLGLVELRLYPTIPGQDWPLLVVPDVVGRSVEKTRGIVKVLYQQEKPRITVNVEQGNTEQEVSKSPLDLNAFLTQVPSDLRSVYQNAFDSWLEMGEKFDSKPNTIHWSIAIDGETKHVFYCDRRTISIIRPKDFQLLSNNTVIYQEYREELKDSPVATEILISGKLGVWYNRLSASELQVILQANMNLAQKIKQDHRTDSDSV